MLYQLIFDITDNKIIGQIISDKIKLKFIVKFVLIKSDLIPGTAGNF